MKSRLLKILLGLVAVVVLLIVAVIVYINSTWDSPAPHRIPVMTASSDPSSLERGEFLYKYGLQCWGCHSDVHDPNASPRGGRKFDLSNAGPGFGVFYTPNITSDKETGIGGWTDGEVVRALREGVGKDGRKLFPLMPMATLKGLSDYDVLALVGYLRTIPPVSNKVQPHEYMFPAKALFALGAVKPEPEILDPITAPSRGNTVEYGRYVASNAGLCYDCHSVRNLQDGSFFPDSLFAGSSFNFGEDEGEPVWAYAPNITMDVETGLGEWTERQFMDATMYGVRPDGKVLVTHMPYPAHAFWDTTDVKAVWTYLQTVPKVKRIEPPVTYSENVATGSGVERGKDLFRGACFACHGDEGKGTAFTNVKLAEVAPSLNDDELLLFVKAGNIGLRMPPFEKTYSEEQLRDVVAYIRTWEK